MLPSQYSRHPYPLIFTNVVDLINIQDSEAAWKEAVTTVKKYSEPGQTPRAITYQASHKPVLPRSSYVGKLESLLFFLENTGWRWLYALLLVELREGGCPSGVPTENAEPSHAG